jgi:hypothetical protein
LLLSQVNRERLLAWGIEVELPVVVELGADSGLVEVDSEPAGLVSTGTSWGEVESVGEAANEGKAIAPPSKMATLIDHPILLILETGKSAHDLNCCGDMTTIPYDALLYEALLEILVNNLYPSS